MERPLIGHSIPGFDIEKAKALRGEPSEVVEFALREDGALIDGIEVNVMKLPLRNILTFAEPFTSARILLSVGISSTFSPPISTRISPLCIPSFSARLPSATSAMRTPLLSLKEKDAAISGVTSWMLRPYASSTFF